VNAAHCTADVAVTAVWRRYDITPAFKRQTAQKAICAVLGVYGILGTVAAHRDAFSFSGNSPYPQACLLVSVLEELKFDGHDHAKALVKLFALNLDRGFRGVDVQDNVFLGEDFDDFQQGVGGET